MKKIHRAWLVCLGCALVLFCTSGLSVNAFTVYQPYLISLRGLTNTQSSAIITVRGVFSFGAMFLTGLYYDKVSYRLGLFLAGLMEAVGHVMFGLAGGFAGCCAAAAVTGLGYGLGTMIPLTILITRWFYARRTLALSLCSCVTGFSTLGIPSLLTALIEAHGLRFTFLVEAGAITVLSTIALVLLRGRPGKGEAYGEAVEETVKPIRSGQGRGLTKGLWCLLVPMLLLLGAMTNTGYSHLSVLSSSQGFPAHTIALGIMVSGIALTVGKLLYGTVAERVTIYRANYLFGIPGVLGLTLLCLRAGTAVYFIGMILYGLGLSFTTVGLASWAGELTRPEDSDRTVRLFQIGYCAGGMLFSPMPGIVADLCGGSYVPAYVFFTFCTLFVMLAIGFVYRRSGAAPKRYKGAKAITE